MVTPLRVSTWIVDISGWDPDPMEWDNTLNLFSAGIQAKIRSYHHRIDAKRSLVGKLLVHKIVCSAYSIPWSRIKFSTNSDGKPYLDTELPPDCRFHFNISHDGCMVACCFSQELLTQSIKSDQPETRLSRGSSNCINTRQESHEIGVDVMEYKLPRSEKTVEDFRSLLEEHLSPKEKELIGQRTADLNPRDIQEASVLDGLLQIWTFKESIIKALGCGLRMELCSISLSNLISHPEINLGPLESADATMMQQGFILPDRSSQLVASFNDQEDRTWKFWSAVWTGPGADSKYILSAAIKSFCPQIISSDSPLIHRVTLKTVSELTPFD
ncbi:hypothetical protein PTTG_00468 [Puccinia triticina 1-1 BBBD Race 1]|uniref:holo-[acyl-carrier-protein] synthase n=2 Tax=Puccinia triticina TaxID=208348 RepID=A0A0C4EIA2_PUCT1|nr:uncharacterized protein PtA15_2A577 [Puccinia triticina]OAV99767.1 hypothetical protein PTTG_00468 [Puccinia triticina 1-1 BBBD Race 1]WAQ82260.1 hypothetical protein PtA15_2A577 [Puccinia triticina]WAR53114.1 hypothetical protein PtB15_2B545 [Puccinia triticina]